MSKLDKIKPTAFDGQFYKAEIQAEGEWIAMAVLSKQSIIKLADYMDKLCEQDMENYEGN